MYNTEDCTLLELRTSLCVASVLQIAAQNHLAAIQPQFHINLTEAVAELQTDLSTFAQEYEEVRVAQPEGAGMVVCCCSQL